MDPTSREDLPALRRRAAGLATLVEVSGSLAATLDLDRILQATTDGVCRLAGFDTAAVYLLEGDALRLGAATPALPPDFPEPLRLARLADHPHVSRALASSAPLLLPDTRQATLTAAERLAVESRELRTLLYTPMIAGVKPVGVLIVAQSATPRLLGADEADLCRTLANLAALATENARLFRAGEAHVAALERSSAEARRADAERLELERRLLHAQKLESLGLLAGGVAHDFNNLLQVMLGNLDVARAALAPGAAARDGIDQAVLAARRAADLTRQLLAFSGKGRFVVQPVDLSDLVRENAHLFRASVPHTCALELRLADDLPAVDADVGQLQQVVMNLITNAADAVGERPGSITLTTALRAGDPDVPGETVDAGAPPAGPFVALEVEDTGCGMDAATVARMFDPFFSTKGVGRGLGMSALLGIVRGHHGRVLVDSAPGRGTAVRVLLPAHAAARADPPGAPPAIARVPARGAVLVVDDEDLVLRACERMVRSLDLPVFAAQSGPEALEVLRAHPGEIRHVLLDLSMPGMDGLATLDALLAVDAGLRVVLTSGFDERAVLGRDGSARRFAAFLQKPYTRTALRDALAAAREG